MGPITGYGYHPGVGDIVRIGGDHGDHSYIMTITPTGGHTGVIIRYAIRTGYTMATAFTGPIERLL
jgi:hypothetical protein